MATISCRTQNIASVAGEDIGRVVKQQLLLLSRPSFLGCTSLLVEKARAIGSRCVSAWHNKAFSPVIEI